MASSRAVLGLPVKWRTFGNGALVERRRVFALGDVASSFARDGERKLLGHLALVAKSHSSRGEISGQAKLRVLEAPAAENWQILSGVEIPVTCFQLLGVTAQSEKDEIAKVVMELKSSVIEDGYTAGTIVSRQVGEDKMVLEIGQAALQLADAKPYSHDLLLSMTLAECSIAKICFENNKISEGFEALAYACYLLRSHISLGKMPLLSQIEESLEDLAPACTLELLGLPHVPDNAECRRGALAALQELIRQGLDVEFSCRVQDWPCFLIQAMNKLMASEIVDLLSWDSLSIKRKNKKSIESQNQRIVLDFNCFYLAMIAHIALGFSTRQNEMISRAKTICECLIISEGAELKFEEAFCSFLLGQGGGMEAVEKLQQLEAIRSSTSRNSLSSLSGMDKDKVLVNQALETWLKDAALSLFLDTHDFSPSMANFFGSPMRILSVGKQKIGTTKSLPSAGNRISNFGLLPDHGTSVAQAAHDNLTNHLDKAFKHLLSVNLQRQMSVGDPTGNISLPSSQLKRNIDFHSKRFWESWFSKGNMAGKIAHTALVGWIVFGAFKLLTMRSGNSNVPYELKTSHPCSTSQITASSHHGSCDSASAFVKRDLMGQLRKFWAIFRGDLKCTIGVGSLQNTWPTDDLSRSSAVAAGTQVHRRQMAIEEAEALVKQWQDIKAEALGPSHQIQLLPNILSESILLKWQELANSAKARSCFWKFVLLQTSILHAKIVSDGGDDEMAEIEAVLEEAAELVDDSEPRKPNYYSTYEVHYILRRQEDGSWRFCGGGIQNQNMT
ncbi:plastid division protein CDP1, chloroplastic [Musa acuminata AAA Group]|uniref:plastid division protein CDP1, chloroplastic n=1 Tax=Musa acuminata AAA Group TaxID=214697 RepID=UPI0031D6A664